MAAAEAWPEYPNPWTQSSMTKFNFRRTAEAARPMDELLILLLLIRSSDKPSNMVNTIELSNVSRTIHSSIFQRICTHCNSHLLLRRAVNAPRIGIAISRTSLPGCNNDDTVSHEPRLPSKPIKSMLYRVKCDTGTRARCQASMKQSRSLQSCEHADHNASRPRISGTRAAGME